MLDELVITAAVGTSRKAPALPAGDPALDEIFQTLAGASPEARLLGAAAIFTRYESCGRLPAQFESNPDQAAEEQRPACSRRAGELLGRILETTAATTRDRLVGEWLAHAARTGLRAPHRLLPALLDYGSGHRAFRRAITDAAGARGAWLVRLNPRWRFEGADAEAPASVWAVGTRDQRVAALGRLRSNDPAAAVELIQSTWKEDSAEDRAAFVTVMVDALGPADEAFLEAALDDRSKQVRAAAAEVLARLPDSAYVRRMIDRATPLLQFTPAKKSGLLRKTVPAAIGIELPPDAFDPAWARDGVAEKPGPQVGRRQWWLRQFLAAIPPTHWSALWNLPPADCVAALTGEFADGVLAAWHEAARKHPDPSWIAALLLAAKDGRGPLTFELLDLLPDDARQAVAAELFDSPRGSAPQAITDLLRATRFPLDHRAAGALFGAVERHVGQRDGAYDHAVTQLLQESVTRVPPSTYDELTERWDHPKWDVHRKAVDDFFQTLGIRREVEKEFRS